MDHLPFLLVVFGRLRRKAAARVSVSIAAGEADFERSRPVALPPF